MDALSKLRSAQNELEQLQENLEEEQEGKATLQKQLATAKGDASSWRDKFENEATPRLEELEEAK